MKWSLLALLLLATLAGGGAAAYRFLLDMPVGSGEFRASPDGRLRAEVMEWSGRDFWSNAQRHWFQYRVDGPGIAYEHLGDPVPGPYFGSRSSHRVIEWSADSSSVAFVFPETTLRLTPDDLATGRGPRSEPPARPCRLSVAPGGFEARQTPAGLELRRVGGERRRSIREIDMVLVPNDGKAPALPRQRVVDDRTVRYDLKRESGGSFGDEITLTAERPIAEGTVRLELRSQAEEDGDPDLDNAWQLLGSARCAGAP